MEKASCTVSSSSQVFTATPSPRLIRSRSGNTPAAGVTTPERSISSSRRFSTSERFTNNGHHRSKSASRSSTRTSNHHNPQPPPNTTMSQENNNRKKKKKNSGDDDASSSRGGATTGLKGPSAWALSPGRTSLGSPIPAWYESTAVKPSGVGGGVTNKVLKYFTQRKVSGVEEEQYHRFRILHNRLLQWRFINSRAEIAIARLKNVSQIQLFSVWLKTLVIRKIIIQKRIALQKIKHLIKLHQILNPQFSFLKEWEKLDRRYQESLARLTRKLSALSTLLPLTHNLKADLQSVSQALDTAIKVMDNIEPLITIFLAQRTCLQHAAGTTYSASGVDKATMFCLLHPHVMRHLPKKQQLPLAERILYQVTELITALKQEEEYLLELMGIVPMIITLLENEKSNRVHLIQRVALY